MGKFLTKEWLALCKLVEKKRTNEWRQLFVNLIYDHFFLFFSRITPAGEAQSIHPTHTVRVTTPIHPTTRYPHPISSRPTRLISLANQGQRQFHPIPTWFPHPLSSSLKT